MGHIGPFRALSLCLEYAVKAIKKWGLGRTTNDFVGGFYNSIEAALRTQRVDGQPSRSCPGANRRRFAGRYCLSSALLDTELIYVLVYCLLSNCTAFEVSVIQ